MEYAELHDFPIFCLIWHTLSLFFLRYRDYKNESFVQHITPILSWTTNDKIIMCRTFLGYEVNPCNQVALSKQSKFYRWSRIRLYEQCSSFLVVQVASLLYYTQCLFHLIVTKQLYNRTVLMFCEILRQF